MSYLQLRCETCAETFKPMCSDTPGELLYLDYEIARTQAGENNADMLRAFHRLHGSHRLVEIEA